MEEQINLMIFLQCTESVGVSWATIEECTDGELGFALQVDAMAATEIISPAFVPTIVFNEVPNFLFFFNFEKIFNFLLLFILGF